MNHYDEPTWWSRNRSWALPTGGCCGCLVAIVLGFVGLTVGGGLAVFSGIKSSAAYTESVALARADPRVVELLGEPIETGFFMSGSINLSGSSGEADMAIPLTGPKGEATLYAVATKVAGEWRFEVLEVAPKGGGDRIDLLGGALEAPAEVGQTSPVAGLL